MILRSRSLLWIRGTRFSRGERCPQVSFTDLLPLQQLCCLRACVQRRQSWKTSRSSDFRGQTFQRFDHQTGGEPHGSRQTARWFLSSSVLTFGSSRPIKKLTFGNQYQGSGVAPKRFLRGLEVHARPCCPPRRCISSCRSTTRRRVRIGAAC